MPVAFSRSLRSLSADHPRGVWLGLLAAVALLLPLAAWFVLARVPVIDISETARLEAEAAAHPIESPVAGEVAAAHLTVGREVHRGDILVELMADAFRLELAEERAHLNGLEGQLNAAELEFAAKEAVIQESRRANELALEEAEARRDEADALAVYARERAAEVAGLVKVEAAAESEARLAAAEAEQRAAGAKAAAIAVDRLKQEHRVEQSTIAAELEALRREVARLKGECETTRSRIDRLQYEIDVRQLRATVDGRVGEAAPLPPGSYVEEGRVLASIIPDSPMTVVAQFSPEAALGRIRAGQSAELRLDGFPWSQYGTIGTEVTRVASEVRDGRVRVELAVRRPPDTNIPLEHGLPGRVEVEVERVSPATLLLRAVGRRVTGTSAVSNGSIQAGAGS